MKQIIFFTALLTVSLASRAQIEFGPYLTYSGLDSLNTDDEMTVQIGVNINDSQSYYLVYWKDRAATATSKKFSTSKIVNTESSSGVDYDTLDPQYGVADVKYRIYSRKLTGLDAGAKYHYFVTTREQAYTTFRIENYTNITDSDFDLSAGKPIVADHNVKVYGEIDGTGNIVTITKGNTVGLNTNFKISEGSTLKFTTATTPAYSFTTPDNSDSTLTFCVISDTQPNYWDYSIPYNVCYYANLTEAMKKDSAGSFIMHGGDMGSFAPIGIKQIESFPELFGNMPFQITEGNHDMGYSGIYNNFVTSDDQITEKITTGTNPNTGLTDTTTVKTSYTEEMIWFDKLFHYGYPDLGANIIDGGTTKRDMYSHHYSFEWGPVHVSVMDYDNYDSHYNTKDIAYVQRQFEWLINDLQSTSKEWKIIMLHSKHAWSSYSIPPLTINGTSYTTSNTASLTLLETVIEKERVAVVIDGHQHGISPTNDLITKLDSINGKNHLRMRIGIDAHSFRPLADQYSFFKFKIDGKELRYIQYDQNNNIKTISNIFKLDSIKTLIEIP